MTRHEDRDTRTGRATLVEPSTAGVRRRIVSTDERRRQDIRERLYVRLAAWDS